MLVAALTLSGVLFGLSTQAHAQDIGGNFPEFAATTGGLRGSFMRPSTARLANGKFVLVMGLQASPLINSGIYFQIYTPQGEPIGNFTRVKPTLMLSDHAPATAAATGNGGFVVVWAYREHFDAPDRILGQRYSAAGAKKGSEFQINQTNPGHIQDQKVVSLADGGFVVVWNAGPNKSGSGEIYARRYNDTGGAVGGEFIVNTTQSKTQSFPAVAGLGNGGFVVAWNLPAAGGHVDIYGQRFAANGRKAGAEFTITSAVGKSENAPVIAGLHGGGFVVAWTGSATHAVHGRRFNGNGVALGAEFLVGEPNYGGWEPLALTVLDDDRFLVAYSKSGDNIYAKLLGPTAAADATTTEFRVNSTATAPQRVDPSAVALSNRNVFVAWKFYPTGTPATPPAASRSPRGPVMLLLL